LNNQEKGYQQEQDSKVKKYLNPKAINRGIILFVIITLISFTVLFLYTNTGETLEAFKQIQIKFIFFALSLAFLDWWLGGMRNHIFARLIKPGISQRVCWDANLANIFIGAVTPSQTGGGPAQLYVLHRRGIKLADGIAISVINFISTLIFFPVSAGLAFYILRNQEIDPTLYLFIKSGFFFFTTVFIVILISLIIPKKMGVVIDLLADFIGRFSKNAMLKTKAANVKITAQLLSYHDTMILFLRKKPHLLILSLVMTFVMYFNKYSIAFVLLLGLGINADFLTVIAIQALIFFILYFAPSPGGSGIAELAIALLMAQIIPDSMLTSFTLLHRAFLLFIPAIIGAFIMLRELKKHSAKT
jgi:uncharacterized protein (TIRG00374 family)